MQNWNQWQLSAGAVATPMPQPPVGYPTSGADPMAMMQAYMQYYNQPAPSGYTAEQWAAAQQQNWAQWQQWQQQYQQWQAQYGEKYQETIKHMSAQNMNLTSQVPQLPTVQPPPPLPKEDAKPPLPPSTINAYQFTSMPPPHQNNLPLFPVKQNANTATQQTVAQNFSQIPPLPPNQPPLPPENSNSSKENNSLNGKRSSCTISESNSAKKLKVEDEELTEAEKTFDARFKQWEEQFNKWKQQNANHPDKTQYKQYEAKWTSWREKLIERREQMRRKREQQRQVATKTEVEKNKSLPGDDKIMNILSSTENQGLINNLLGIGKTLGLTGKQNTNVPPPPPPPPATETVSTSSVQTTTMTSSSQANSQSSTNQLTLMNMSSNTPWNSQQWASQYNTSLTISSFPNFQSITGVPPPPFGQPQTQMPPPNFTQPPPNYTAVPNFSQPPPGFTSNESRQHHSSRSAVPSNVQGRPPFCPLPGNGPDENLMHNERANQADPMNNFDSMGHSTNFSINDSSRPKEAGLQERFGRSEGISDQQGNQFRCNDMFGQRSDERGNEIDQFRRDDRNYQEHGNNQFSQQKMNFNSDRFNLANDRFGSGNNRFLTANSRFAVHGNDRFEMGNDRFGPGDNRFTGANNDRFGVANDRIGQGTESVNDRFVSNNEPYGPTGDRFNRNNMDRFNPKEVVDSRRDNFPNNARGFNRNNQFDPPDKLAPELKKLMEKRRAAMDVFKPSYLDSEKSTNIGSLSESFKKITGDSLFVKPGCNINAIPRGPPNFGCGGPVSSRMLGELKSQGNFEFGPRCPIGIGRNSSFDSRDAGNSFRGPNSSPQQMQDIMINEPRQDVANHGKEPDIKNESEEPVVLKDQSLGPSSKSNEQVNIDTAQKKNSEDNSPQKDIPILEKPSWMDTQITESSSLQKDNNTDTERSSTNYSSVEQDLQNTVIGPVEGKQEFSNDDNSNKKVEVLPFMGENDPKPEDLNLEPPPELPNLGPISSNAIEAASPLQRADESYDTKVSSMKPFPNNPECLDSRGAFDSTYGPRGIQHRSNVPVFGPRTPHDGRLPMFGPRGSSTFPFNPTAPGPYPPGPRGPNSAQFGLRGPNELPFGPRGLNSGQFGPRGVSDGQFVPRGVTDGMFGLRGPTDGQFGLRGPNSCQFGNRNSNINPFGPRFDAQMGLRRSNDVPFSPRGLTDGQFGSQALSVRPFGTGRSTDDPFDNRGLCDAQFIPGGSNDVQPRFSGPNERAFGSRRGDLTYQRNPGAAKSVNDGQFPNRYNDKQFDNNTDMCFGSRALASGPNDRLYDNRQFDIRGMGVDNNSGSKMQGNAEVGVDADVFDNNEHIQVDQNMQPGPCNSNEIQNPGWRQSYPKNSFGDTDQRSGRDFSYTDKSLLGETFNQTVINNGEIKSPTGGSKSILPDRRSEKTIADLASGDYKLGYGELSSGSEYSKFGNSNMYMKRSDNRQPQIRSSTVREFCIEKQFNYNHAGANSDLKFMEHIPAKVIDYAHASRSLNQDHLTPVQCFDYGHGNLKPTVPEHELYPKKDFRNWEENEQNLKEYTEKIRRYEYYASKTESARPGDYNHRRDNEEIKEDRSEKTSERERREKDVYKTKDRDDRAFSHVSDKDQDTRYDKSGNKERTKERNESSQKETSKKTDKDEDRSKGSVNWQESSNKNVIDTKLPETSVTDSTQHNVLEPPQKTLELAKVPNCTMVDDLLCPPGRQNRPPKIAIILRGPPGSGKSFVAKLIKDKEVEQGGSAPRILSLDDYFLVEKELESTDDNGKKVTVKEMVYEYEEVMEHSYITSLVKAFKKNIMDGFFNFIILDCINEKISDYEEMWSFAKTKGFKVYVCEMEMDLQICLKRNIHNRTEDEINRIIDYFEPTPSYHQKLDVNSMLQEQAIEEVHMEDSEETQGKAVQQNEDSQDSQDDTQDAIGVSKWERMEAEDKLDRLDGLARKKNEGKVQTMKDFLQVPDYYNMEDTSGKKRVRWADLEERKEQEKMRAVGFVVGHTNWDRMMDPTKGGSALTRTKFFSLS